MRTRKLFYLFLLALVFSISANAQNKAEAQEWKSIVTLKTTRAELENQFGKPSESWGKGQSSGLYKLAYYNLLVNYSKGCTGKPQNGNDEYDVPPETVTHFTVYLKEDLPLSILNIDRTKFEKIIISPIEIVLDSVEEGVNYRISEDEIWAISIYYRPKKADYNLVCQKKSDK